MFYQLGLCLLELISHVYLRAFVIVKHICLINHIWHMGLNSYHTYLRKHLSPEFEIEPHFHRYPFYKEMSDTFKIQFGFWWMFFCDILKCSSSVFEQISCLVPPISLYLSFSSKRFILFISQLWVKFICICLPFFVFFLILHYLLIVRPCVDNTCYILSFVYLYICTHWHFFFLNAKDIFSQFSFVILAILQGLLKSI